MRLLDHDLPERHWFNFVLGFMVASVLSYLAIVNYAQYTMIVQIRKDLCGEECIKEVLTRETGGQKALGYDVLTRPVAAVDSADLTIPEPTPSTPTKGPMVVNSKPFEAFVTLSGGSAASTSWTAVNDTKFSFDLNLYPSEVTVRYEGWIELFEGASRAYVRLYDTTNNRMVDGSEVSVTTKGRASFYSGNLSIWRGTNQYRVEVKSDTGYTVTVSDLRLAIKKM